MSTAFYIFIILSIAGWSYDLLPRKLVSLTTLSTVALGESFEAGAYNVVSARQITTSRVGYHVAVTRAMLEQYMIENGTNGSITFASLAWPDTAFDRLGMTLEGNGTVGVIRFDAPIDLDAFHLTKLVNEWTIQTVAGVWSGTQIVFSDGTTRALPSGLSTPIEGEIIVLANEY